MKNRVCLYVPDSQHWLQKTKLLFLNNFGGYTCVKAEGGWKSGEELVIEKIYLVYSFWEGIDYLDSVIELAKLICKELNQECVALEVNDELRLIS